MYFFLKYLVTCFYKKLRIKIVVSFLFELGPWLIFTMFYTFKPCIAKSCLLVYYFFYNVTVSMSAEDRKCHCDATRYILSVMRQGAEWFCGLSSSSLVETSIFDDFSHRITSFKQTKCERVGLAIGLVILIILDLFLFVFFCTGSDFGLVHDAYAPPFAHANESIAYSVRNSTTF